MKMIALLGAAALAAGGLAAAPAEAQHYGYHHGYHGYHHGYHGFSGGYRHGYGYGYHRGWRGYHHRRVVCGRFGRCHRF